MPCHADRPNLPESSFNVPDKLQYIPLHCSSHQLALLGENLTEFFDMASSQSVISVKQAFELAEEEQRAAFVPYVTAGFPTLDATVAIMKGMQAGGADVIEVR
jgi:hypothetical protein